MPARMTLFASALGLTAAMAPQAKADPLTFTWDPSKASPALAGAGPAFTADSISTTDFLLNAPGGVLPGGGTDTFILQINGFSRDGVAVPVTGLNSSYGLYIEGTVAVIGVPSVYGPGTIALMADPTNNDGTASSTWNLATNTGIVSFSNPANTADDITLATGDFITGSFGTQSNGQPGVNFLETFDPNPAQSGFFVSPVGLALEIQELLFNTATSRVTGTTTDGNSYVLVNDGIGSVDLQVPEPASGTLVAVSFVVTAMLSRRRRRASDVAGAETASITR